MLQSERNDLILEYIASRDICTIGEIAQKYNISNVTVHRILNSFQKSGLVEKVRGGVKAINASQQGMERRFNIRFNRQVNEKKYIANLALQYLYDGATIFLDGSSTSVYLAREIELQFNGHITVVTNSPIILYELMSCQNINLISTGGEVQFELDAMVGYLAISTLEKMQFKMAFVSCAGMSLERGITTAQSSLAEMVRTVCSRTDEVVLMLDSSKFSKVAPMVIGPVEIINTVITDSKVDNSTKLELENKGIKVIY